MDEEMLDIKKRLIQNMLCNKIPPFLSAPEGAEENWKQWICGCVSGIKNGTLRFGDIDYLCPNRANWQVTEHFRRLYALCVFFCCRPEYQEMLRPVISALLADWLETDYYNSNWWYRQICIPMCMADIVLLWDRELNGEQRAKALALIERGNVTERQKTDPKHTTGANLLWFCTVTLKLALITGNQQLMLKVIHIAENGLDSGDEGIQSDGSYFQHGHRLYTGGYGLSFAKMEAEFCLLLQGTDRTGGTKAQGGTDPQYRFSDAHINNLMRYTLDGLRYMMHGAALDPACTGRSYTTPESGKNSVLQVKRLLTILLEIDRLPRRNELTAFLYSVQNNSPNAYGVRYFPRARYLCLHLDDIFISFKGFGTDLLDSEIINGQGGLGYNLSYGTHTTVMRTGNEYDDIAPIWDYARIPGTTAPYETDKEMLAKDNWTYRFLPNGKYGGVQAGEYAVCYEWVEHGTELNAACFASPQGMIFLGSNIRDRAGRNVYTTVEQCHANGEPEADKDSVLHNGILYQNLDKDNTLVPFVRPVIGSWQRNYQTLPDTPVSGVLFTLMADRKGTDHYAYAITSRKHGKVHVEILRNDARVQAVLMPDGTVMAVFYETDFFMVHGKKYEGAVRTCSIWKDEERTSYAENME